MVRLGVVITLAACGRTGFDPTIDAMVRVDTATDDVQLGHDEDGDGVPDSQDTCPHIVAPQDDGDGDRIGNACDPRPAAAGDLMLRFDTMTGAHPFVVDTNTDGTFTVLPDALSFRGTLGPDGNLYGGLGLPLSVGTVRVTLGVDVLSVIPGSSSNQNQLALHLHDGTPPNHFVELNQDPPAFDVASVTLYDGVNYFQQDQQDLASEIHAGPVFFQTTQVIDTGIVFEVGWPGEMYVSQVTDNLYQGATMLEIDMNNLELEIRYLLVITSP